MKLTKNELLEKINNLNKQKPLKENKEIQRVASPADADALEQHEEALKQNKERLDPKNYAQDVKDLVQETASEESRYRHFDVVDRKELAKRINEAKEKGLDFKVSRSIKEGFRYTLKVLDEDYMKKEAGDPDVNCSAFNKATDVQASSPATGLGEDVENEEEVDTLLVPKPVKEDDLVDYKELVNDICCWLANNEDVEGVSFPLIDHLVEVGYDEDFVNNLFEHCDDESEEIVGDEPEEEIDDDEIIDDEEFTLDEDLDEELKVYTSTLEGFHPSVKCEDFWNEIVENDKVEDLEYALEALYPDGISDIALDDLLSNEEDWIRDIIELPYDDEEYQENSDEDEESEDDENEYPEEDNIESDELEFEDESDEKEPSDDETIDDEDDIEPVDFDDEEEVIKEPKKELEEESLETQPKKETDEIIECDEIDDDKTQSLADGFINKNFKENTAEKDPKSEVKEQLKESEESEDEVVDVCEDDVNNMLGCPKKEEEK